MKPNLQKHHSDTQNSNPTPIDVFTALSNEHRQHIIADLVNRAETASIHDLADCLASKEYEPTPAGAENALLALHHIHLPHLAAAGLITYDTTHKTVALRVNAADLRPFLDLTTATIRQQPDYH
jgi:hypothetical protein